ncbi:MAG TPA: DUF2169 domain-containing protein, partial [Minicystis sp.]|nr:DUF2169 domain-containing protein [Minicystis sp.]
MAQGLEVVPRGPVACAAVLWRARGVLRVTVVVKATFGLVHEGTARLVAPVPIVDRDKHRDKNPTNSVEAASDLAPFVDGADVTLVGHAYTAAGHAVPAMSVRLAVGRDRMLIDKTLHVFGDRTAAQPGRPAPFHRMPLVYERAYGGPDVPENPVGVGARGSPKLPNIVDPQDPLRPAGFAPIASIWPVRRGLLGGGQKRVLRPPILEIDDAFPWDYYHAAPGDQRLRQLVGDEWLVLDGLHPALPRLATRLPGARGVARAHLVHAHGAGPPQEISLAADTLAIDVDQQRCTLAWRGHLDMQAGAAQLDALRLFAGVELPGYAVTWPTMQEVAAIPPPAVASGESSTMDLGDTAAGGGPAKPSTPFAQPPTPARSGEPAEDLGATR